jgi:hypothetical protein
MAQRTTTPTAWAGWAFFAGALLFVVGGLQIISGLAALFRDDFYAVTQAGLVAFNYTTWGWTSIVLGVIVLLTGVGVLAGSVWARIVAVFFTVLVMIENLAFITAYPLWSIIAVVINGCIIYALTMHGDELQS